MQKIYYTQTIPDPALYQSRNVSVKAQRYAKYYTYFIFFEFTPHLCSWNSPQKQSFSLGALINFPHLLHPIIFCLIFSGTDIDRPVVCSSLAQREYTHRRIYCKYKVSPWTPRCRARTRR